MSNIRNFSIIAHIDHGKSTIADRLIEHTFTVEKRQMRDQILDSMDIERERGITVKAQTVRLKYKAKDGKDYILNLIDTPGHVDFTYEVSRSLAACEGALLVVDAAQGVEAQTIANAYMAVDQELELVPVLNKIDLPSADPDKVKIEIEEIIGIDAADAILASAKSGLGTEDILEAIIKRIPAPEGSVEEPLKAMIVDSWYDSYLGVIVLIRMVDGQLEAGDKIQFMSNKTERVVDTVGYFLPKPTKTDKLVSGEVGFLTASIKNIREINIGDTITIARRPTVRPFPGFKKVKPVVFCGMYPVESKDYEDLRDALEKLSLNDSSITFEPETSAALGFGFRGGFLGLLHMEIIQERLEREFDLDLVNTAPTVVYRVTKKDGEVVIIDNPAGMPEVGEIELIEEPVIDATVILPEEFVGGIMQLMVARRGMQTNMKYINETRVMLEYKLPLSEVVMDFYDKLKSVSKGYASFDYEFSGYQQGDLVKLDILLNKEKVDALSIIVHKDQAFYKGRDLADKLKEVIHRQMFDIAIQAAVGNKILARTTVKAYRKNVTAKCYGGDISRKRKLLEKQKAGKKRMKNIGNVEVPQEAFMAVLKLGDE
ncbi:GTP-binding protein LepA [Denitrovibrio acetiphilus DSM 12809]|uniref:Elongation factor 4 n=1 Tax=Denitrovibrio acetiphilus (strain DSM 12809 / NBRC 114555 / N2460) TaxID=522772 RepID=D4H3Y0_DENA2|nr:translation elongation factor 4 [Denitrovibrio acetiphilus]ADD67291.1 GTP-binding protein LepA [Denitrovibrio acetiphilus DSM 12809]